MRRLPVLAALLASLVTAPTPAAGATPVPGTPAAPTTPVTVTLFTGDRVTMTGTAVSIEAAPRPDGTEPAFQAVWFKGDLTVTPGDVDASMVDPALLNVSQLAELGITDQVPLIVQGAPTGFAAAGARQLSSVDATAVTLTPEQAAAFWAGFRQPANTRLWLDRPVSPVLDESVPQVGAPALWEKGFDGTGVPVAVLDTGIDQNHPDLAGKVTAAADFSGSGSTIDRHGHGTHVASTVAGSGGRRGVAPGASLLVGKVLGDDGKGSLSMLVDGMEWAAEQGARVVNMSVGAPLDPSGDDLAVQALERLSAETGALFVVAAGNAGPKAGTVGSPGAAPSALTVAAVDKSDVLAEYSSRGPLPLRERLLKPDLAAPGSGIVAARAAGTSMGTPVDANYTSANGTSMATPHVAGAAALLAQQHPTWTGQQLRAALTSSGKPVSGTVFEVGAGRLDVAAASAATVLPDLSVLDFGRIAQPDDKPVTRTVTYTNHGDTDRTLRLEAPFDGVSTPDQVIVPAGGTAAVDVRLEPGKVAVGTYSGVLLATSDDGPTIRTPVAFDRSIQTFPVRIDVVDRAGDPGTFTALYGFNVDNPEQSVSLQMVVYGSIELKLPAGRWSFYTPFLSYDGDRQQQYAHLLDTEVALPGTDTVTLDARDTVPIKVSADRPTQPVKSLLSSLRTSADGSDFLMGITIQSISNVDAWISRTEPVSAGTFLASIDQARTAPMVSAKVSGGGPTLNPAYSTELTDKQVFTGTRTAPVVDVGTAVDGAEAARLRGAYALAEFGWTENRCSVDLAAIKAAGAIGVLQFDGPSDGECAGFPRQTYQDVIPLATLRRSEALPLRELLGREQVRLTITGAPASPFLYQLKFYAHDRIRGPLTFHAKDRELAQLPTTYRSDVPRVGRAGMVSRVGTEPAPLISTIRYTFPLTRTELVGPIRRDQVFSMIAQPDHRSPLAEQRLVSLRAGKGREQNWLSAPRTVGPMLPRHLSDPVPSVIRCAACRAGDTFYFVPGMRTADPGVFAQDPLPGETHLYAGNREIPAVPHQGQPSFGLPARTDTYRLTHAWQAPALFGNTHVSTEWTFRSGRVTRDDRGRAHCPAGEAPCAVQRLLYPEYEVDTGPDNRIPRGTTTMRISFGYEDSRHAALLWDLDVWLSFDDGATWQPQQPGWGLTSFPVRVTTPKAGQTVSIRVRGTDLTGSRVTQTVVRAFGIAP